MRRESYCTWMVNSAHMLSVEHPLQPGRFLTVDVDSTDYEELHVTFYRSYRLRQGEVICANDTTFEHGGDEAWVVPADWVGSRYDEAAHGNVRRTPQSTYLPLTPRVDDR